MKLPSAQGLAAQLDEVFVVGEEKDLGSIGEIGQLREDGLGAVVIEGDEQIIENEWHRLMRFEIPIERRQPESQVELIPRAIAQAFHWHLGLVRTDADENGKIVGTKVRPQPAEGIPGDGFEHVA